MAIKWPILSACTLPHTPWHWYQHCLSNLAKQMQTIRAMQSAVIMQFGNFMGKKLVQLLRALCIQ